MIEFLRSIFNFFAGIWNSMSDDAKAEIKKIVMEYLEKLFRSFYRKYTGNN